MQGSCVQRIGWAVMQASGPASWPANPHSVFPDRDLGPGLRMWCTGENSQEVQSTRKRRDRRALPHMLAALVPRLTGVNLPGQPKGPSRRDWSRIRATRGQRRRDRDRGRTTINMSHDPDVDVEDLLRGGLLGPGGPIPFGVPHLGQAISEKITAIIFSGTGKIRPTRRIVGSAPRRRGPGAVG